MMETPIYPHTEKVVQMYVLILVLDRREVGSLSVSPRYRGSESRPDVKFELILVENSKLSIYPWF